MISWRPVIITGIGCGLCLTLLIEMNGAIDALTAPQPADAEPIVAAAESETPGVAAAPASAATSTILARPLFNWNRRASGAAGHFDGPLPRLSGIMIGDAGRYAIFAAQPGGKPQTVPQGGTIGRFTIDAIAADHIILKNGATTQTLGTSFGTAPPPPLATPDAS